MPLLIPDREVDAKQRPVRVGIINIMPRIEAYEPLLLEPLSRVPEIVEPVFIRLESHAYQSSDHDHLERFYRTFDAAMTRPLDGLILTGAPVEELPFEDVRYWRELVAILGHARAHVKSTLGLCWGGLALGALVGVPKVVYREKLFGVFENTRLDASDHLLLTANTFRCAHSRHSGASDSELERAAADGRVRLLAHAPETGYSVFETPDHRFVMHLGHPEYVAERIVFEWERDRALGRSDVAPPRNFDPKAPVTSWHDHREALFAGWVRSIAPR